MPYYIRLKDRKWPLYEGDIRAETGAYDGPFVCPEGYTLVTDSPVPVIDEKTEFLAYAEPVEIDGSFVAVYVVRKIPERVITVPNQAEEPPVQDTTVVVNSSQQVENNEITGVDAPVLTTVHF